jgi:hypothetical protein
MKSAAGAAAQAPASMANQFQTNAIASDLSVMADQAGSYARRTAEGNQEQMANRAAAQGRLAQEAAQAAQERANSLEMQRMALAEQKLRSQISAQESQMDLAMSKAGASAEDDAAKYDARKSAVLGHAARNRDGNFLSDLNMVVKASGTYKDAVDLLDNLDRTGQLSGTSNLPAMRAYLRQIFKNAARGKEPDLRALGSPTLPRSPYRGGAAQAKATGGKSTATASGMDPAFARQVATLVAQGVPYQEAVLRVRSGI